MLKLDFDSRIVRAGVVFLELAAELVGDALFGVGGKE